MTMQEHERVRARPEAEADLENRNLKLMQSLVPAVQIVPGKVESPPPHFLNMVVELRPSDGADLQANNWLRGKAWAA